RYATFERAPRGLGGKPPRLDRVVNPLQRRHVDETDAVAAQEQPRRVESLRQRDEAALGDCLRAPLHALAALEDAAHARMRLQLLQQIVNRELGVAVVEPDDHPDRDELIAHRIDERAAELAVALAGAQRPPHRVHDAVERLRDLPHLLHAERPHLRVLAAQPEPLECSAREMTLRALRENRHARSDVGPRLEVPELLPRPAAAAIARAHADDAAAVDEQRLRGRLRQERDAELLGLFRKKPPELRHRRDQVPMVDHRQRRRDPQRMATRQEEHRLRPDRPVERQLVERPAPTEETLQGPRVHDGSRQQMRARRLALLEERDRNVAEPLSDLRLLLDQLSEANRRSEPRRTGADDQEPDVDPLVDGIRRSGDRLRRRPRGRIVRRPNAHERRARTSSVSFGTISCRSPTTPRSANSKMGAFGSLLIATITFEPCMPTLCWIAPEMPSATYSFGDTVLPVWPTCAEYGYQPASTTARVAPTAPPSTCASSSASENFSGS